MTRSVVLLLALIALALIGRLDRDGILAHTDAVARAVGIELRIEVTVQRANPTPAARPAMVRESVAPAHAVTCPHVPVESPPCE
ncbi:MAG: hypothetical protein OEY20_15425 [Gemmatimonadota bacterium]|nr:hypothetical protein [Gemmatimonadota bacterium]MDH5198631.1 hypothetical protein [Gemmatimonadota bacterium]